MKIVDCFSMYIQITEKWSYRLYCPKKKAVNKKDRWTQSFDPEALDRQNSLNIQYSIHTGE